jgi:uncharacterized repeat protein (TIGR01451 family)
MCKQVVRLGLVVIGSALLVCALALIARQPFAVASPPPTPQTPPHPPRPPEDAFAPSTHVESAREASSLNASSLKAVLLVGPIDGDYGQWTQREKDNMDLAAEELESFGVTVLKFYTPSNDWEQIKSAADDAHFLFYRGHGVYDGSIPPNWVGGFALKDKFASSDDIRNDLNLAPNAVVMLYGCFTAGSSSAEGDEEIDLAEAKRRVGMYSSPFVDLEVSAYYANWFGNAFQMFVRYLLEGQTLGEAYESFYDFDAGTVDRSAHPNVPGYVMWIDKDFWGRHWQYNNAFVGKPDMDIQDALGPQLQLSKVVTPTVVISGETLTYTLSVTNTGVSAASGVVLEDYVNPPACFVSCSGGCSGGDPVTWSGLTITAGQAISRSLVITISRTYSGATLWNGHYSAGYTTLLGDRVSATGPAVAAKVVNRAVATTSTRLGPGETWTPTNWLTLTTGALAETAVLTLTEFSGPMVPADPRFTSFGYDFALMAADVPTGTAIYDLASPLTLTLYVPSALASADRVVLWMWSNERQKWEDLCQAGDCQYLGQELTIAVHHLGDFTAGVHRHDVFLPTIRRDH